MVVPRELMAVNVTVAVPTETPVLVMVELEVGSEAMATTAAKEDAGQCR